MRALRLCGEVRGRNVRLDIANDDEHTLGSDGDADLVLRDPTVSRRHATLRREGEQLAIRDLGSTNGTWVAGRRVEEILVEAGSSITFGHVNLQVETIAAADLEAAVELPAGALPVPDEKRGAGDGIRSRPSPAESAPEAATTLGLRPLDAFTLEALPELLRAVQRTGPSPRGAVETAQRAGAACLRTLPVQRLAIFDARDGLLFSGERPRPTTGTGDGPADETFEASAQGERSRVVAAFGHPTTARVLRPVLDMVATLVDLAGGRPEGPPKVAEVTPPPLPAPPTLDPTMLEIYGAAARVAAGDVRVLILGESGTGKEVLARYLHQASPRSDRALVALNCAALPSDLLEAELFGVERGTATGVEARPGKFELADGGTLLLDEIGDMRLETQAKILRVLQEQEVYRLGTDRPRPARARVLAATNQDLPELIAAGRFRRDLYHRIAGWVVELPPLRQRPTDIPQLAIHFLAREAGARGLPVRGISRGALDALVAYDWPGNVRQLEQEIGRAVLFLEDSELLESSRLSPEINGTGARPRGLEGILEQVERREIERALAAAGGRVGPAAEGLGIHRATLYRRLKALGLGGPREEGPRDP